MTKIPAMGVTTSQDRDHLLKVALEISSELGIPYIPRENLSIKKLLTGHNIDYLVIVREDRIQIETLSGQEFFFHPGLSIPRVKVLRKGELDSMITAMDLQGGDRLLDCTLGLANDAIVASYGAGEQGQVVGLESSPIIYLITKYGLRDYQRGSLITREAMARIEVRWADYREFLVKVPDQAFDVVYFDPMFKDPLLKSSGINSLRTFANYQELTVDTLNQGRRVARKRVVVKDRVGGPVFSRFNFDEISGGKYSPIAFGIFHC